jgi:hypothetical protein
VVKEVVEVSDQLLIVLHIDKAFGFLDLADFFLVALKLFLHFFVYPLECFYFLITCLAWLPRLILRLLTFQQEGVDLSLELVLDLVYVSVEFWVQHFESRQVLTFGDHLVDLVGNHCLAGLSELTEIVNLAS